MRGVAVATAVILQLGACRATTCRPNGGTVTLSSKDDLAAVPDVAAGLCTSIEGNLNIPCDSYSLSLSRGGPIDNLEFLSQVTRVSGYVRIENCDRLETLSGLESLRTIGGTPEIGLTLQGNQVLQ